MEEEHFEDEEPWYKGPVKWILGLFLVLLIILWLIPVSGIKLDPSPSYISNIDEIVSFPVGNDTGNIDEKQENYLELIDPTNPLIKQTANKIITLSKCKSSKICNAKAVFYFVRNNINYVNDPVQSEYLNDAIGTLSSGSGDCDDFSILLSNLLQAIGIPTRYVFVPGHVYVQAYLPDALNRYKSEEDWINLDATCSNCEFGEITYESAQSEKRYLP